MKHLSIKVKYNGYKSLGSYIPDEALRKVWCCADPRYMKIDGITYRVNIKSLRLQCFKRSKVCVNCGRVGNVMSLDRFRSKSKIPSAHFNLYCEEPDGTFVLMTQDHIIPKSKGGKNHLSNLQTMCTICNRLKDNRTEEIMEITNGTR